MVLLEQEPPDDKPVARGCHTFGRIKTLRKGLGGCWSALIGLH